MIQNNKKRSWFILFVMFLACTSCIRDQLEPCPPLSIRLKVKDKNYFNVDLAKEHEEKRSENLAFKEYIPTLLYTLRDAESGDVLEEQGIFQVEGEEKEFTLPICGSCLPHGKYILTVWGGLKDLSLLSEDRTQYHFHPNHQLGEDVYLAHDTLVYDYNHDEYILQMERTKGKLIAVIENLDRSVHSMSQSAGYVYEHVHENFTYHDKTYVQQSISMIDSTHVVSKGIVVPSLMNKSTKFDIRLYNDKNEELASLKPQTVAIKLQRNTITALKYIFQENGTCSVYILMDDSWKEVHDMDVEE